MFIFGFIKEVFLSWLTSSHARSAAAVAFYTIFSLAPTLVLGVFIAGFFLDAPEVQSYIVKEAETVIGEKGAESIRTVLQNSVNAPSGGFATLVSLCILFYGSSIVFSELRYVCNDIFKVKHSLARERIIGVFRARLLGVLLVISLGFFLVCSLLLSTFQTAFNDWLIHEFPGAYSLLGLINLLYSTFLVTFVFAVLLKFLPEKKISWFHILPGAVTSSLLFGLMKGLIGLYLGHSTVSSAYGAAGSLIVILIWVYFSVQILLLGAEVSYIIYRRTKD